MFRPLLSILLCILSLFSSTPSISSTGSTFDCDECITKCTIPTSSPSGDGVEYSTLVASTLAVGGVTFVATIMAERTWNLGGKFLAACNKGIASCCLRYSDCTKQRYRKNHKLKDWLPTNTPQAYPLHLGTLQRELMNLEGDTTRRFLLFTEDNKSFLAGYRYDLLDFYQVLIYKSGQHCTYERTFPYKHKETGDKAINKHHMETSSQTKNIWELKIDEEGDWLVNLRRGQLSDAQQETIESLDEKIRAARSPINFMFKELYRSGKDEPQGLESALKKARAVLKQNLLKYCEMYPDVTLGFDIWKDTHKLYMFLPITAESPQDRSLITLELLIP